MKTYIQDDIRYTLKQKEDEWVTVCTDDKIIAHTICENEAVKAVYNHIKERYDNQQIEVLKLLMTKPKHLTIEDFEEVEEIVWI